MFDPGPGRLVEDPEQGAGPPAGLAGRPPQRRDAGDGLRSGHDVQEPAGDAEADPLRLGDGSELVLLVGSDLDGSPQPRAEGPILGLLVGEAAPQFLDAGFGRDAVHGLDDLLGLTVERLSGLLTVLGHLGDVAVPAAEDGEGGGDALGDRGHGDLLRRGRSRDHTHDCTRLDGNCPPTAQGKRPA